MGNDSVNKLPFEPAVHATEDIVSGYASEHRALGANSMVMRTKDCE